MRVNLYKALRTVPGTQLVLHKYLLLLSDGNNCVIFFCLTNHIAGQWVPQLAWTNQDPPTRTGEGLSWKLWQFIGKLVKQRLTRKRVRNGKWVLIKTICLTYIVVPLKKKKKTLINVWIQFYLCVFCFFFKLILSYFRLTKYLLKSTSRSHISAT